mgnify:FL=1
MAQNNETENLREITDYMYSLVVALKDDFTPLARKEITLAGRRYVTTDCTGEQADFFKDHVLAEIWRKMDQDNNMVQSLFLACKSPEQLFHFFYQIGMLGRILAVAITPEGVEWTPAGVPGIEREVTAAIPKASLNAMYGVCADFFIANPSILRLFADWLAPLAMLIRGNPETVKRLGGLLSQSNAASGKSLKSTDGSPSPTLSPTPKPGGGKRRGSG